MKKFKIEYFTDPLCCWSWAFEPQLRKLRFLLKDRLHLTYVMGGLLRDWKNYNDQMNDIARPAQMGPLWMQARHMSGQPIEENIWISNPIDTSYLACMAVKAAALQSKIAEEAMLRKLREAVMIDKKNIGEVEVILEIAGELEQAKVLKKGKFREDLFSDELSHLFKQDLDRTKASGISRFPSLLISYKDKTYQVTGYRPFSELKKTFSLMDPNLDLNEVIDQEVYSNSWENLTDRELLETIEAPKELSF
ncbi:DsbA family protein [Salinimicrobium sediminilitoris]|uniref:DsbA family protein n=1 Tax=Salinimicrobium sediminilitoris TaxID=2876715 RepID=UPI001E50B035|nr:DsbA family protein [Salinimicrobium sediminilitoris]MCC8360434.1 DsbA family protein [Salinimicrobium sediminilitoris]